MSVSDDTAIDQGASGPLEHWKILRGELSGGIAGAVTSLPQSIAYGIIAFSPLGQEYAVCGALAGVYSSIVGGLVSCLTGSVPVMVSGSRAATAVIFAAFLSQCLQSAEASADSVLAVAFTAVFLSGLIQLLLGLVKVGYLIKFLPQTVIAGFLNGTGLLILAGQVRPLTGVDLASLLSLNNSQWMHVEWGALLLGLTTALIMRLMPRLYKGLPAGLVAIAVGSLLYHILLQRVGGGFTMGEVFPTVGTAMPTSKWMEEMAVFVVSGTFMLWLPIILPASLSIAVISSLDSLLSAAALDNLTLGRTNGNRELMGQGLGNLATALVGGTPSSGSMGRSGALFHAGGRTRWSVVINVLVLVAALAGLGSVIGLIPKAVVAGVLLVIGVQLFDKMTIRLLRTELRDRQWGNFRSDLLVIACVVSATLIWNLITAVGLGILLAVIIFVTRMSRSVVRRIYRGNHVYSRQVRSDYLAMQLQQHGQRIVVLELEGAIFFGSADSLEMEIERLAAEGAEYFVLDMKRVKHIDSSGAFILQRIHQRLSKSGKLMVISYVDKERRQSGRYQSDYPQEERRVVEHDRRLWRNLWLFGLMENIGESAFLVDTDTALGICEVRLLKDLPVDEACFVGFDALKSGVFGSLASDELKCVLPMLKACHYAAGQIVFSQGEPGDALYVLLKGSADVLINIPSGRQKRVQTLFPGAVFGEMALMDGEPRAASVRIIENSRCLRFSREDFATLMQEQPHIALKLFQHIAVLFAKRLRSANLMIMDLEA